MKVYYRNFIWNYLILPIKCIGFHPYLESIRVRKRKLTSRGTNDYINLIDKFNNFLKNKFGA